MVNVITEDDFEGARLDLKTDETLDGGGRENTLEFTFGSHFNNDRGYFLLSAAHQEEGALRFTDHDWALIEADYDDLYDIPGRYGYLGFNVTF